MSICNKTWAMTIKVLTITVLVMTVMSSLPVVAQEEDQINERMREAEERLQEREREMDQVAHEMELQRAERVRVMRDENIEVEIRMREAEASMVDAAQHVAELSSRRLPNVALVERIMRGGRGPVLGVTIGTDVTDSPVEGVSIRGVSPGGAADEAGLRADDIITSINDESLTADNDREANEKLLDFMQGVEEGDELSVEYLRNGKMDTTAVVPRAVQGGVFRFEIDGDDFTMPGVPVAPHVGQFNNRFVWISGGSGLGDMEMVKLTERLGDYFGTDEGLLIVRAPKNEDLKLQDGDVIQSIDGREPTSVDHAMRILGSYQSGESLEIEIMRDKRKQKITIEVPDNRRSSLAPPAAAPALAAPNALAAPHAVTAPAPHAAPDVQIVPKVKIVAPPAERT